MQGQSAGTSILGSIGKPVEAAMDVQHGLPILGEAMAQRDREQDEPGSGQGWPAPAGWERRVILGVELPW